MIYRSKNLRQRGFTLLELIVVLAILGIAMAIGTVSMHRAHQKSILKDEAVLVQGALRQARDASLIDRMPVTFVINSEDGNFWLEKGGGAYRSVRTIPKGLEIEGMPIIFFSKGNSTGGTITVKRTEDDRGYVIDVDPVTGTSKIRRL